MLLPFLPWTMAVGIGATIGWFVYRQPVSMRLIFAGLSGLSVWVFSLLFYSYFAVEVFKCEGWGCSVLGPVITGLCVASGVLTVASTAAVLTLRSKCNRS